jgi:glutaminyl-peptide cyclotransferase
MIKKGIFALFIINLVTIGCNQQKNSDKQNPINKSLRTDSISKFANFNLMGLFLHDTLCFTEGFFFHDNKLFESSGAPEEIPETRSFFGIYDLAKGKFLKQKEIDKKKYFGEGITLLNDKIYQLTYKNQIGFIYDANSFQNIGTFNLKSLEGWGLTNDSMSLIMSDGSHSLTFLDPSTFRIKKVLNVVESGQGIVNNLNELEYVDGFIYANIFTTNFIVKIDSKTGLVVQKFDLSRLYQEALLKNPNSLEMNGIAYKPQSKHFFITGKMWPYVFELVFN